MEKAVSVIVPAYNEENGIAQVIEDLKQTLQKSLWRYEIIVVDDGSTDQTRHIAQGSGASIISSPKNIGYGGALKLGIEKARHDWIATIDGDGSYPAGDLLCLLEYTDRFDMVIGARQGRHYWGSLLKYPARLFFLALAQFVVGERIPDANSGLRLFKKSFVAEMMPRLCRGFSFSTTLTLSFMSDHRFVKFAPIRYLPRVGQSKIRYIRDTFRTLQLLIEAIVYSNPIKASLILVSLPATGTLIFLALFVAQKNLLWLLTCLFLLCWSTLLLSLGFILFMLSQNRHTRE